ncbi:MAG: hypothetical protein DSY50_07970 [Desulfobulbus sp.]|nr:MAG: hypothetical protein DSY50_07970 [Desulfobulbus sp.]RUM36666.1 MAG: hypothetical protein DSY58_04990 [Desulfobulbus sp.]RUM41164.1 MAG: hypothetical protein DSY70_01840 [Desulfobulbus sp.]
MSEEEISFLSVEEASRIIGAIQEEEDIQDPEHRILTVYSKDDKELCWFDYDEVIADVNPGKGDDAKEMVSNYIIRRIPSWVLDM